jgi:hypothetical protein
MFQEELQVICCRKQYCLANDFQNIAAASHMVQAMQIVKISQKIFL